MSELFTTLSDGTVRPATEAEAEAHYAAYPEQRPAVEDPAASETKAAEPVTEPVKEPAAEVTEEAPAKKASPRARRTAAKKSDEA